MLVTDRRLVLAEQEVDRPWHRLVSVSRQVILDARRVPRLLQGGRLMVDFADGSEIVLFTELLFAGAARRLAAALDA